MATMTSLNLSFVRSVCPCVIIGYPCSPSQMSTAITGEKSRHERRSGEKKRREGVEVHTLQTLAATLQGVDICINRGYTLNITQVTLPIPPYSVSLLFICLFFIPLADVSRHRCCEMLQCSSARADGSLVDRLAKCSESCKLSFPETSYLTTIQRSYISYSRPTTSSLSLSPSPLLLPPFLFYPLSSILDTLGEAAESQLRTVWFEATDDSLCCYKRGLALLYNKMSERVRGERRRGKKDERREKSGERSEEER